MVLPLLVAGSGSAVDHTTNIEGPTAGFGTQNGNEYFVYVKAGEYVYASASSGTGVLHRPGAAPVTGSLTSADFRSPRLVTAQTEGVWTYEYDTTGPWTITVFDGDPGASPTTAPTANEVTGRVWSEDYRISQQSAVTNMRFWMLNDNGYEYALRLPDYNGVVSAIIANSLGVPQGTSGGLECAPSYHSRDRVGGSADVLDTSCAAPYRLFFEEPADDLPASAPIAPTSFNDQRTTQTIAPEPVEADDLTVSDFTFTPTADGTAAGTFTYDLGNFIGGHKLEIDVDHDGDFNSPVDRSIRLGAAGAPVSYEFDGIDGDGDAIAPCTDMTARVAFDRLGEVHVVQTDVEARAGIEIIRMNGAGAPDGRIYWDDSQTSLARVNTTPETTGSTVDSAGGGAHGWAYHFNSWGNEKFIDDWTYQSIDVTRGATSISSPCEGDIALEKSSVLVDDANENGVGDLGDELEYTFTVANAGNVDLSNVTIDDARVDEVTPASQTVPAGLKRTFTARYQLTQDDIDAGQVTNTATATGTEPDGDKITDDGEDVFYTADRDPGMTVDKSSTLTDADDDGVADIGETIDYAFLVTNTGNVTMSDVTIDDPRVSSVSPASAVLLPGKTQTFTASYTVTKADILTGGVHNEATATGKSPLGDFTSTPDQDETDTADAEPGLAVVKTSTLSTDANDSKTGDVGDVVTYEFVVTNNGNTDLTDISVSDPMLPDGAVTPATVDLPVGDKATFTATYTIDQDDIDRGELRNVATAEGTFSDPETGPESVTSPPDDATTPLTDRDPKLSVVKTGDLDDVNDNGFADAGEEITYSFLVKNEGNTTLESVRPIDLDPEIGPMTPGPVTLAPGDDQSFTAAPHKVTQADVDAGHVTNTAVARGNVPGGPETTAPADELVIKTPDHDPELHMVKSAALQDENGNGTADAGEDIVYSFTIRNDGNVTMYDIEVDDAMLRDLLPPPVAILSPGDEVVVTADAYTVTADDVADGDIRNVATVVGTSPDDQRYESAQSRTTTESTEVAGGGEEDDGKNGDGLLPNTGAPFGWGLALLAVGLLGTGGVLLRGRRRTTT